MRVFLTGADGYIGAIMGPKLIEAGHEVMGLDTGFYRRGWLFDDGRAHPAVVSKDQREHHRRTTSGASTPSCTWPSSPTTRSARTTPASPWTINHKGSVGLARKAREAGVKRFIQASSCSTYGAGGDEMRTETSALAPQTAYARCKILVENGVRELMDDALHPGLHAQRHRLRRQPAAALRPRAQQPLRLRPHHRRDPHDLGRLALAADHPYRGHLRGDALRAEGADSDAVAGEAFNVGADSGELPHPRDRRDRGRDLPGLRADHRRQWRRHPQLPRLLRQDPRAHARVPRPAGPPSAARGSSAPSSSASGSPARCSRRRPSPASRS